jgi:hypothetical protein
MIASFLAKNDWSLWLKMCGGADASAGRFPQLVSWLGFQILSELD